MPIKSISDQIGDMLDAGMATEAPGTESSSTDAPGTESMSTEVPATDSPTTDSPSTEAAVTDAPATDAPTTEVPTTEVPDDKYDKINLENEELRKKIEELSGPRTTAPKTSVPATEVPLDKVDFVGDVDLDELTRDPVKFNELLNKVFKQGVETTRKVLAEGVFRSIPEMVKNNVVMTVSLRKASEKFYEENPDLVPFKKVVAAVFEEVASEHSDWSYEKAIKESGIEARKRLELHVKAVKKEPGKDDPKPKLPRKKGSKQRRQEQPNVSSLESDIDQMNQSLTEDK